MKLRCPRCQSLVEVQGRRDQGVVTSCSGCGVRLRARAEQIRGNDPGSAAAPAPAPPRPLTVGSSPALDVASARARYWWSEVARPWLRAEGAEIGDVEPALWWRDATLVLATPLDFGDGDPLATVRESLLQGIRVVEPSIQAVVWEYWEPGLRRRRAHEHVLTDATDVGFASAQVSIARSMRTSLSGTGHDSIFTELAVAGDSRRRLWLVSRDPYFRSRVGSTPGAASSLHEAVARATGRKTTDYTVVIDPSWPWPWRSVMDNERIHASEVG